jgi:hypothetical protein
MFAPIFSAGSVKDSGESEKLRCFGSQATTESYDPEKKNIGPGCG